MLTGFRRDLCWEVDDVGRSSLPDRSLQFFPLSSTLHVRRPRATFVKLSRKLYQGGPTPTHSPLLTHSLALAALAGARWRSLALAGTRWPLPAPDGTTTSMCNTVPHCAGSELFPCRASPAPARQSPPGWVVTPRRAAGRRTREGGAAALASPNEPGVSVHACFFIFF